MKSNQMSGGIKGLLFAHCEKMIAFIIILLAGYIVYVSTAVEGISKTHTELNSAVSRSSSEYEQSRWVDLAKEDILESYSIQTGDGQINGAAYLAEGSLNPNVVPPTVDRTDPKLLAADGLQVAAVTGLLAFIDENVRQERILEERRLEQERDAERRKEAELNRDDRNQRGNGRAGGFGRNNEEDMKGRRPIPGNVRARDEGVDLQGDERIDRVSCAVVLAKVPVLEQYKIYTDMLKDAQGYNPTADIPEYRGYLVERTEVVAGQEPDWQPVAVTRTGRPKNVVTSARIEKLIFDWVQGQEPVMDPRFEHPELTMPLPPLVGQLWKVGQIVHDDVPLLAETEALQQEMEEELEPEVLQDPDSPFGRSMQGGGIGRNPGRMPGRGRGEMGMPRGRGMRGMGMDGEMGMGMGMSMGRRSGSQGIDEEVPHYMLRFFDFTVAPGRRYQYRVRVVLTDVNKRKTIRQSYLSKEVAERIADKRSDVVMADWSPASPVVSVPLAGDVFVADAKIPKEEQHNSEPTIDLLVNTFELDEDRRAMRAETINTFSLGSVMNFKKDIETISSDQRFLVEKDDFPFRTGITLCDVSGGEQLSRDESAPIKVLFMDSTGTLFVRDQSKDKEKINRYKSTYEEDKNGNNRGNERGFFPGGGGDDFRGGGGFEEF